jgi:hypothetical protein
MFALDLAKLQFVQYYLVQNSYKSDIEVIIYQKCIKS